jgi:hypothetical protein
MWTNLTVAENHWTVYGLKPDVLIYGVCLMLAWYIGLTTRYRRLVTGTMMLAIIVRLLSGFGWGDSLHPLAVALFAINFAVAGATIYGKTPALLHKQLVIFLALCIPIMIMQILGVSSVLMTWTTAYLDDPDSNFVLEDLGTFKSMPVYPTLFVGAEDLIYSIAQARPVGLMHNNNPLSVFVSIAIAINLAIARTSRIRFSDIVVTAAIVLTMSKLVFVVAIILYLGFLLFGSARLRMLALKLIVALIIALVLYYFLFPGLFMANFSEGVVMTSLLLRLVDLVNATGLAETFAQIIPAEETYKPSYQYVIGEGYSTFATLARSEMAMPVLIVMAAGAMFYAYRLTRMVSCPTMIYVVTLFACILTQFAVPFTMASSFQLIVGFALFPIFSKLWPSELRAHLGQPLAAIKRRTRARHFPQAQQR